MNEEDFDRGTYIVTTSGGRTTEVEADRWDYGETGDFGGGSLRLWDGDKIVAEFKFWDSVRRKSDD